MNAQTKGSGSVTKTHVSKKGGQENVLLDTVDDLDTSFSDTDGARVAVGFGFTKNLGNFESARVEIRIELPCLKTNIQETYNAAKKFVEEQMETELSEIEQLKRSK
jgi:hypothetical protein